MKIRMKNKLKFIKKNRFWMAIGILAGVLCIMIVRDWKTDEDYKPRVCGGDWCFMVELARTPAEQKQGLMYRESMEKRDGMLFMFPESKSYNFRMKNTLIPLDMLRIDEQFNVVKIITAQPCTADPCPSYSPWVSAKYVLEINAGMAQEHEITEWTKMRFVNVQ